MGRFRFLFRGLIAFALLAPISMIATAPVSAATAAATTTCSNGVDNTPGLGLICEVTIVNTVTGSGGSAKVTIHECHGAAGAPTAACSTKTTTLTTPVTSVNQCNNSIGGGGGTLRCSVTVTTNFYGGIGPGATAATVNQCVGSGGGITTGCDPIPANTTGAAITQCNGSANGGTLVQLTCTATGAMSSALVVTVTQCNGSANGGGALVICSTSLANRAVTGTPPPTGTVGQSSPSNNSTPLLPLLVLLASCGFGIALVTARHRSAFI